MYCWVEATKCLSDPWSDIASQHPLWSVTYYCQSPTRPEIIFLQFCRYEHIAEAAAARSTMKWIDVMGKSLEHYVARQLEAGQWRWPPKREAG